MHRPVQPLPEWEVTPSQSHPDRLPLQNVRSSTDPCRYKMVSEVGSVHSDSVSLNRKEAATALASMRGPLVDLESPHMDGGKTCDYESPVHGDLLTWEKADMLHRRRSSPDPTNYSNITPHVTAPKVDNGASANDINQLTQMMSHLCQSMGAFAQALKTETADSLPMAVQSVPTLRNQAYAVSRPCQRRKATGLRDA